ncbi:MAG: hypothetical protein V2I32_09615 [Desulforhopalus sp.]|jgi:hypothetical protein|nr:hypothetical protein [Desulforhopalus sp.]
MLAATTDWGVGYSDLLNMEKTRRFALFWRTAGTLAEYGDYSCIFSLFIEIEEQFFQQQ